MDKATGVDYHQEQVFESINLFEQKVTTSTKALLERSPRHFKSDITCRTQPAQQPATSFETQSLSQSSFGPDVSFIKIHRENFSF